MNNIIKKIKSERVDLFFDSLETFTHHLLKAAEGGKSLADEKDLLIEVFQENTNTLDEDELKTLASLLVQQAYPWCLQIKSLNQGKKLEDYNQYFLNIYLRNKRLHHQALLQAAGQLPQQIQPSRTAEAKPVNWEKVSRAKINLARGNPGDLGGLQVQRQQQRQQQQQNQQQQQQSTQQLMDRRRQQLTQRKQLPRPVIQEVSDEAELGQLIDRFNIISLYPHQSLNLYALWNSLVGEHEKEIAAQQSAAHEALNRAVTHVTQEAMEVILKHSREFKYGLVLDNLPAGFYLQGTRDKLILCYRDDLRLQPTVTPQWLTISLKEETTFSLFPGDGGQFLLESIALENPIPSLMLDEQFVKLQSNETILEERRAIWMSLMTKDHPEWRENIEAFLTSLELNNEHAIKGLTSVLLVGGAETVLHFLNKLSVLNQEKLYKAFKNVFLAERDDYSDYVSVEGFDHLDKLLSWNIAKRGWWEALTQQHFKEVGKADFKELILAFDYFTSEVTRITHVNTLPITFPVENIKHMKVALDRLLFIIDRAVDKEEQLNNLAGLDLSAEGAYYASRYEDYKLVTREMGLSLRDDIEIGNEIDIVFLFNKYKGNRSVTPHFMMSYSEVKDKIKAGEGYNRFLSLNNISVDNIEHAFTEKINQLDILNSIKKRLKSAEKVLREKALDNSGFKRVMSGEYAGSYIINDIEVYYLPVSSTIEKRQILDRRKQYQLMGYKFPKTTVSINALLFSELQYDENKKYFFRYIGQQEMALPIYIYRNVARKIAQMEFSGSPEDKAYIKSETWKRYNFPDFLKEEIALSPNFSPENNDEKMVLDLGYCDKKHWSEIISLMNDVEWEIRKNNNKYSVKDSYRNTFQYWVSGDLSDVGVAQSFRNTKGAYLLLPWKDRDKARSLWHELTIQFNKKYYAIYKRETHSLIIGGRRLPSLATTMSEFENILYLWEDLAKEIHASIPQDPLRGAILHLVALCSANERQFMVGNKIDDQIEAFLQCISEDIQKSNNIRRGMGNYLELAQRLYILISQIDVQYRPSLPDITNLFQIWMQIHSHTVDVRSPQFFEDILPYINKMQRAFYDVLERYQQRVVAEDLSSFDLITFFRRIDELELNINMQISGQICILLSLLHDIGEMSIDQMRQVIDAVLTLTPSLQQAFLASMQAIQVKQSTALPTQSAVMAVIEDLKQQHAKQPFANEGLEEVIAERLQRQWPDVYIVEQKPVETVMLGMVKILGEEMEKSGVVNALQEVKNNPSVQDNPVIRSAASLIDEPLLLLNDFLATTRSATSNDFPDVLISLKKLEVGLASFLSNFIVSAAIALIFKSDDANVNDDEKFLHAYLREKKLAILFDKALREQFQDMVKNKLIEMRISHQSSLLPYLLNISKGLSIGMPIDEFLTVYNKNVTAVSDFLNNLVSINNTHHADFRKVYQIIETEKSLLPLADHSRLLNLCSKGHRVAIDQKMALIYRLIGSSANTLSFINPNDQEKVRIKQVYRQLELLMNYEDSLTSEQFLKILQLSFQHNLTHEVAFPFEVLAKLSAVGGEGERVFKQLIDMIAHTQPAAETNMMQALACTISKMEAGKNSAQMMRFIQGMLAFYEGASQDDWESYRVCLEKLPSHASQLESIATIVLGILTAKSDTEKPTKEVINQLIDDLLTLPEEQIQALNPLFAGRPAPSLTWLNDILHHPHRTFSLLQEKIKKFDRDPFAKRNKEEIEAQFSIARVKAIVSEIKRLPDNEALSEEEQINLVKQFMYINTIGREMGVAIPGKEKKEPLIDCSRAELGQLGQYLLGKITTTQQALEKEKLQLLLLAVVREAYYRTNGKFPHSTQMLAALMLIQFPDNIFLQLNTGEGKSILEPLALMLERAKGVAVNACTANADLAYRDQKSSSWFFDFFGVETQLINKDSPMYSYAKTGINYATMGEGSLYRANAKLFGEQLRDKGVGFPSIVIDESDADILDNRTAFNLASGGSKNPYAWIYPLINEFIDLPEYQNIDPLKGPVWENDDDVLHLKQFLGEKITHFEQREQFKLIKDKDRQWKKWLEAATIAQQHLEGREFIVRSEIRIENGIEREVSLAVPLDKNIPQEGSTREHGIQQFLHARLQLDKSKEDPTKRFYFPIEDEAIQTASETVQNYIKRHLRKGGRLICISATLGSLVELAEQHSNYEVQAFNIPPHLPSQRNELPLTVKPLSRQTETIMKELRDLYGKTKSLQPNLIICKDMEEANKLHQTLQDNLKLSGMTFQCVLGTESPAERQAMIKKAGESNTITISTSLLGRGTDITVEDKRGLSVIQTYLDNERGTRQIMGRAARNGEIGRYVAILGQAGNTLRYGIDLMNTKKAKRGKHLQAIYQQMDEEAAIERHYSQDMDSIQNSLLDHFHRWYKFILRLNVSNPRLETIERTLLEKREALIQDMKEKWQELLEESDKEKKYTSNLYVRRNSEGQLEYTALDHCIEQFEVAVKDRWEVELAELKRTYFTEDQRQIERYMQLDRRDIQIELDERKIKEPLEQEKLTFTQSHLNLDTLLTDKEGAYLAYAPTLLDEEREVYAKQSGMNQLSGALSLLSERLNQSKIKKTDKELLEALLVKLQNVLPEKYPDNLSTAMDVSCELINAYHAACSNNADKFGMQSFLGTVIEVTELLQREKIKILSPQTENSLMELKEIYFTNAYDQLAQQLNHVLKWRSEGKWYHQIERRLAKDAADEILGCLNENSTNNESNQDKFKRLYQVLLSQKFILKDKLLFGLFHENINKTIDKTLTSIEYLSKYERILDISLTQIKEEAKENLLIKTYTGKLDAYLKKEKAPLGDFRTVWADIKQSPGLFNFDELLSVIEAQRDIPGCQHLIREIQQIKKALCHEMPNAASQLSLSHLIKLKQAEWKDKAKKFAFPYEKISFSFRHEGFRQYGEVTIRVSKDQALTGLQELGFKKLASRNGEVYVKRFHHPHEWFVFEKKLKQLQLNKSEPFIPAAHKI